MSERFTIGLWRCTWEAGGTSHVGVFVFNTPESVMVLVEGQLFSRADLVKRYPGTSGDLECLGDALLVPVPVSVEDWMICTEDEKATMIYRALDDHELRS